MDMDSGLQLSKYLFHDHSDSVLGSLVVMDNVCVVVIVIQQLPSAKQNMTVTQGSCSVGLQKSISFTCSQNSSTLYPIQLSSYRLEVERCICRNIPVAGICLHLFLSSVKNYIKFTNKTKFYFISILLLDFRPTLPHLQVLYFIVVGLWHSVIQFSRYLLDDFLFRRPPKLFRSGLC